MRIELNKKRNVFFFVKISAVYPQNNLFHKMYVQKSKMSTFCYTPTL